MKNSYSKTNIFRRPLAFLLAVITILSLIPGQLFIPAAAADARSAAPASLTNHYSDLSAGSGGNWYGSYQSSNLTPSAVNVRAIPVTLSDSTSTYAMCYNHALAIRTGSGFNYSSSITDSSTAAGPFLAWFYFNVEAGNWSAWETNLTSGWVNVILWMAQAGVFTNYNDEAQLTLIAEERVKAVAAGGGNVTAADSVTLFQQIISSYKSGDFGSWSFDIYNYSSASYQPLLVGRSEKTVTDHAVYVKLLKTGDGIPLAGAVFGVYTDPSCTNYITSFTTSSSQESVSGPIGITSQSTTLYVKELTAPNGYTLNRTVYSVSVDGTVHNTPGSAAAVFGGASIENTTGKAPDAGSVLQKIDGSTGFGIGPATFELEGNAEGGQYVSMTVTTDASGSVDLQWSDAESASNYIAPGEYTVREISAPAGYEKDTAGQHLSLWLEYDSDLDEYIPRSSGPITFLNYPQHSVTLKKVDESGTGLPGAVFDVYRNGTLLQSAATSSGGTITLNDVASGYYTFVETAAPAGYVTPIYGYTKGIYVDATDASVSNHTITMTNYQYPDIIIEKYDAATNLPLAGAQFEVKIDGTTLGTFLTGGNGTIAISYAKYGAFLTGGNSSWTVTVTEVSPPNGYFDAETATQTNEIRQGQTLSPFVYKNRAYPNVEVYKLDAKTNLPLAGVEFTLENVSGSTAARVATTDSAGKAVFERVPLGTYTLSETAVPPGYLLSEKTHTIVVDADSDSVLQYEYKNDQKPSLLITKMSKNLATNIPIAGVGFLVQKTDGETVGTYYTDPRGEILLEHLDPGKYTIMEVSVPDGWVLDSTPRNVTLVPNETASVLFENRKEPSLTIRKVDTITGDPLAGVEFYIEYRVDGSGAYKGLGTYFTNASGLISLKNLDTGWYKVTEVAPPSGYQYHATDGAYKEFHLEGNEDYTVTFRNTPLSALVIRKIDSDTGLPVPGATFQVRYLGGQSGTGGTVIYQGKTSENGSIVLTGLPAGTYIAEETIPAEGYELSNPSVQTAYLSGKNQDVVELEFANAHKGALVIRKLDSVTGLPLKGAQFKVTYSDGTVIGPANGMYTTDAEGLITIDEALNVGATVVVQEIIAPEGYVLDTSSQTVKIKENTVHILTFYNTPKSGLAILKLDSVTGQPLKGAQFKVTYSDGGAVGSSNGIYTTDAEGFIAVDEALKPGVTIIVQEISAPEGYVLDTTVQTVRIQENTLHALTFYNTPKGSLIIEKRDSVTGQPLAGAQFRVTTSSGEFVAQAGGAISSNGLYTTDVNGKIHITGLNPDTYVVTELSAPEGYNLDAPAQTVVVKANDTQTLTFYNSPKSGLQIVKLDKDTQQPIKGAEFTLYKPSGEVIGTYTTDKDGLIILDGLAPGWIKIVETKAPDGYLLDDTPKDVEITSNQFLKLVFENVKLPGLQILKLDEDTRRPIAGVEFRVAKMNGEVIGTYRTDSKGTIHLTQLEAGWYTVSETAAADGYLLNEEDHNVQVKSGETAQLAITNQKASGILIFKTDSVTGEGVPGARFLLSDRNHNPIGVYQSDDRGRVYIDDAGLTEGKYFLEEVEAPSGYLRDTQERTVWVKYGSTTRIEWENTPERGQIMVTKRSAQFNAVTNLPAGTLLSGAVFEIYTVTGNLVDRMVSDSNGVAASKPIPLGVYVVKEVTPPKYYALNPREFLAEIRHNGDIVRFEVLNENSSLGVTIQKKSSNAASNGQALYYDLFGIANTSTVALESFYVHDRLPTDAVRGVTVFTGTWSHRLTYQVTYKTNYSADYRVLASGLSTKTNYELSIHPNVLGLQSGEYVTDVRWEFGTVPAGFASDTNPKLQCQVLSTLPKGYKIVNRADVGGLYIGQWETAQTSWTTLVYDNPAPAPQLPKTGH